MIVIIDYGMGNLGSILNMLKKLGIEAKISSNIEDINKAKKLILPGVGSFDNGINTLRERGLEHVLNNAVIINKVPILGICLGMQLFTKRSDEGKEKGLGWFDAETIRFKLEGEYSSLKIPHMGWNFVNLTKDVAIFKGMYEEPRFYFVHSYFVKCNEEKDIAATSRYGIEFVSALYKENIYGTQFHPEKSHKYGMKVLINFAENV